ncbi:hypothetical protein BGZ72_007934 [Mortierella alpina]|nr:hypothetical protein BGZ72_007934 [Mortierella alpina]
MVWEGEGKDTSIPDLETIIKDASRNRFSQHWDAKKIKSLYLPTCDEGGRKNPLPFLLLKSDLLDLNCFMIPTFTQDSRPEDVEQAIREYCPGLRHVECPHFSDGGQDGRFVRAFIRGCTGLQSFTSEYFSDRVYGGMLADEEPPGDPRFIIQELITHHWETLHEFELTDCEQVFSCDQQAILSQCKQLKQFMVWASSVDDSASIKFTDVARDNWICKDLRELGLTLNRHSTDEDEDLDPEGIALAAKHTYAQIGRLEKLDWLAFDIDKSTGTVAKESDYAWDLTLSRGWLGEMAGLKNLETLILLEKLEELRLDIVGSEETVSEESDYTWDLTLSRGWLGEMAGLRSLKTLILFADFWSKVGQTEVEFMHEYWPLLSSIGHRDRHRQHEPHEEWLCKKRPNFSFD